MDHRTFRGCEDIRDIRDTLAINFINNTPAPSLCCFMLYQLSLTQVTIFQAVIESDVWECVLERRVENGRVKGHICLTWRGSNGIFSWSLLFWTALFFDFSFCSPVQVFPPLHLWFSAQIISSSSFLSLCCQIGTLDFNVALFESTILGNFMDIQTKDCQFKVYVLSFIAVFFWIIKKLKNFRHLNWWWNHVILIRLISLGCFLCTFFTGVQWSSCRDQSLCFVSLMMVFSVHYQFSLIMLHRVRGHFPTIGKPTENFCLSVLRKDNEILWGPRKCWKKFQGLKPPHNLDLYRVHESCYHRIIFKM